MPGDDRDRSGGPGGSPAGPNTGGQPYPSGQFGQGQAGQGQFGQGQFGQGSPGATQFGPIDSKPTKQRWPRWSVPVLAVALLGLVVGGFLGARALVDAEDGEVVAVHLVDASESGDDPFTPDHSVVTVEEQSSASVAGAKVDVALVRVAAHGDLGVTSLDPIGHGALYGTGAEEVCDVEAMAASLEADDDARAAWTGLMGVDGSEVESTLAGLTPLVLTRDTAVTNSKYRGGGGEWFQAVLQAGTAVLVDGGGTPRVRCSCSNPLREPALPARASITGERWGGFDPSGVITVTAVEAPGDQVAVELPVVDLPTGHEKTIRLKPSGRMSTLDGYLVDDADGVYVVSETGERTRVLDHPVAAVFDDGAGGLVYQHERSDGSDLSRRRQALTPPSVESEAGVWHLPAGAVEPVEVLSSDDVGQHWYRLEDVGQTDRGVWVAAYELRGPSDCDVDWCSDFESGSAVLLDLVSGEVQGEVGYALGSEGLRLHGGTIVQASIFDDHASVERVDLDFDPLPSWCEFDCVMAFGDLFDEERWVGRSIDGGGAVAVCGFAPIEPCDEIASGDLASPSHEVAAVTYAVEGEHVVVSLEAPDRRAATVAVYDFSAAGSREAPTRVDTGGRTRLLSAPLIRPAGSTTPVTTQPTTGPTTSTTQPTTTTTEPERATRSGLYLDGVTLEGLLPLRFGASLDEVIALTGESPMPMCDPGSPSEWSLLLVPGVELVFDDDDRFFMYFLHEGSPFRTPGGLGIGSTLDDLAAEFPELTDPGSDYGYDVLVIGGVPTRMIVNGAGTATDILVAEGETLVPASGLC